MRISDWSSDVCSSDLGDLLIENIGDRRQEAGRAAEQGVPEDARVRADLVAGDRAVAGRDHRDMLQRVDDVEEVAEGEVAGTAAVMAERALARAQLRLTIVAEEFQVVHRSEAQPFKFQATMRIPYATYCLNK